jgi:membrane protease YdiL (CAAX protease family)
MRPLAVAASLAGFVFFSAAMGLAFRLFDLPADALRMLPAGNALPWWTAGSALVTLAFVAAVAEEVGLRGYLQNAIEEEGRRSSPC